MIEPDTILEIVSLHAAKVLEDNLAKQFTAKQLADPDALIITVSYWPGEIKDRLYARIQEKAVAYKNLVANRPYVVGVFGNFEIEIKDSDITECVFGDDGLLKSYSWLSGVVRFIDRNGIYRFTYFPNPDATNPFAFPEGNLDLYSKL